MLASRVPIVKSSFVQFDRKEGVQLFKTTFQGANDASTAKKDSTAKKGSSTPQVIFNDDTFAGKGCLVVTFELELEEPRDVCLRVLVFKQNQTNRV